jgi:hypothetical protein
MTLRASPLVLVPFWTQAGDKRCPSVGCGCLLNPACSPGARAGWPTWATGAILGEEIWITEASLGQEAMAVNVATARLPG